jgi:hypothetical protein
VLRGNRDIVAIMPKSDCDRFMSSPCQLFAAAA